MYADDNASYTIYITGLVGKNSGKAPLEIYYGADNPIACAFSMNKAKSWNVFAKPMLMEDEDLSMNGWTTKDGEPVSDKLSSRIALVTTRTTPEKTNAMLDLMGEQPKDPENVNAGTQNVIASETYDISLNVCRKYVVKTGHKLKLSVGFPAGYGPEDAGVTFKAYHFITDAATGEVTGVEEIPCIVTEYGLIIMCDSFSPFAVAVVEDDGTVEPKEKSVVLTATDGGKVKSVTTSEARALDNQGTSETMITLRKDETKVINIKADEGYELEKLTICGTEQDVSEFENKENINTTISYDDVQGTNCIVDATFVAKSVVQEEADKGETVVIQTKGLTKRYGELTAVDHLDLTVYKGEVFGLLGPNGAGKTTTTLMLLGLTEPDEGEARINSLNCTLDSIEVKKIVGYLPDNVGFYSGMTGRENLRFTGRLGGLEGEALEEKIEKLLARVNMTEAADKKAGTYSRGMRQRLGIADVLMKDPEVIIMDEPTLGIDPEGIRELMWLIRDLAERDGKTVLLSSHQLHQVQRICDRMGIFVHGKMIACGTLEELGREIAHEGVNTLELAAYPDNMKLRDILNGTKGVTNIEKNSDVYVIHSSFDIRRSLARELAGQGYTIMHLRQAGSDLDEIYRKYFEKAGEQSGADHHTGKK